jgi:hypothetical protein
MLRRVRKRTWVFLAVISLGVLSAGPALAANLRAERSDAGVRATLSQYDTALLSGNGKTGCALLTTKAQAQLAKADHATSCANVFKVGAAALKSDPKATAALRGYASKVHITLDGDNAVVPKLDESGHTTLTYTHGLWYLS